MTHPFKKYLAQSLVKYVPRPQKYISDHEQNWIKTYFEVFLCWTDDLALQKLILENMQAYLIVLSPSKFISK